MFRLQQQPQQQNEQAQQVNFVSYRAVPVQVINKSCGSPNKNGIDVCSKSDKTNSINIDNDHSLMQSQTKSHTNLSESSEKCDNNNESIGENTTILNANTNANTNTNVNVNVSLSANPKSVLLLNDGAQSGCVNSSSGNGNMISVTDNTNNLHPNHTSQVQLNQRTFTSTEAQTDDLEQQSGQEQQRQSSSSTTDTSALIESKSTVKNSSKPNNNNNSSSNHSHGRRNGIDTVEAQSSREQRRRERRERRQPRNTRQQHGHVHPPSNPSMALHSHAHSTCELLPDILHNHVISHPPPYTTLPMPTHCQINAAHSVLTQSPPPSVLVPGPPSALIPIGISDDGRYTFPLPIIRR